MHMQQLVVLMLVMVWAALGGAEEAAQEAEVQVEEAGADEATPPQEAEDGLLTRIAAAHQERTRVQGRLLQRMLRADDPMRQVTEYTVAFHLRAPDHYHLRLQPVEDQESTEWFLSNGAYSWHAVQDFSDEPPLVTKKAIERDEESRDAFARISDFFRMELDGLREDFRIQAIDVETSPEDDEDRPELLVDTARYLVLLTARRRELQEHVDKVFIELDQDFGTVALRVIDGSGNTREFLVQDISYPDEIDKKLFVWPEPRTSE